MGVQRFRDISEVPVPPAGSTPTENLRRAFELADLALRLAKPAPQRGVRKFESMAAASSDAGS